MAASVLILGGNGFLGMRLARRLADEGRLRPIIASRSTIPGHADGLDKRCCDASDTGSLGRALAEADYLVEAISGAPRSLLAARRALLATRRLDHLRGIILVSSAAVYGTGPGQFDEHSKPRPDRLHGYACAKATGDQLMLAERAERPPMLILRPGCIYGAGDEQWSGRLGRMLAAGRLGHLGRKGEGECNFVHVDDVTRLIAAALDDIRGCPPIQNVVPPLPGTWNDMFDLYATALGLTPRHYPEWFELRRQWAATSLSNPVSVLLGNQRDRITPSMRRLWRARGRVRSITNWSAALTRPTPLDEGLAATAAWLKGRPDFQRRPPGQPTSAVNPASERAVTTC